MSETGSLEALQRIAVFSAHVRGHQLGAWLVEEGLAEVACTRCGAGLRVVRSLIQPEMEGPALETPCSAATKEQAA